MNAKERLWHKRLDAWRESGLSQRAFCLRSGLCPASLSYWHRRAQPSSGTPTPLPAQQDTPHLIPIEMVTSPAQYDLVLANGRRLSVSGHFEIEAVRALINVLEASR